MELSAAWLRPLFESSDDLGLILSPEGIIQLANPKAIEVLGVEVAGSSLRDRVPGEQAQLWLDLIRRPAVIGAGVGLVLLDAQGRRVPVDPRVTAAFEEQGARLLLAHDLRPLEALQRALEAARLQLSEEKEHRVLAALAGAAAHELNQPLTAVLGYAELVRRKLSDDGQMAEMLDLIIEQSERMATLVKKIGRATKFETKSYLSDTLIVDFDRAEDEKK